MTNGQTADTIGEDLAVVGADTGETLGLPPARLTVTFGFGAGLFVKDGKDRYGLASHRPEALVDLPKFNGDQLVEALTGGDLSVQACADDPQVAFHAVRQLARLAADVAQMRWTQTGFITSPGPKETPRNLMGFKDGTNNPSITDPNAMGKFVWVGSEGPDWMRGGSYLVVRRIRIALEHWDRMKVAFQEQTIGRHKYSGRSPRRQKRIRLAGPGRRPTRTATPSSPKMRTFGSPSPRTMTARGSSAGHTPTTTASTLAERWPPWRQGMEYDAGLLFICYQQDPRTGFIKVFDKMSKLDMLNQFVTHTGGGLFACPGGVAEGGFIGQRLFETA